MADADRVELGHLRVSKAASPGIEAVRKNWRPFLLIQACAFCVLILYNVWPAFRGACGEVAAVKTRGGYLFSAIATVMASMAVPAVAAKLTRIKRPITIPEAVFQVAYFAMTGMLIDLWYRVLSTVVGTHVTWGLVIEKTCLDMLVFSPFLNLVLSSSLFLWKDYGFSFKRTAKGFAEGAFVERYTSLLITCWAFWTPVLFAVYSMPPELQFSLFVFAQAAWSLLLLHISGKKTASQVE